jgi:hypothetical protein
MTSWAIRQRLYQEHCSIVNKDEGHRQKLIRQIQVESTHRRIGNRKTQKELNDLTKYLQLATLVIPHRTKMMVPPPPVRG